MDSGQRFTTIVSKHKTGLPGSPETSHFELVGRNLRTRVVPGKSDPRWPGVTFGLGRGERRRQEGKRLGGQCVPEADDLKCALLTFI